MKKTLLAALLATALAGCYAPDAFAAGELSGATKLWTFAHQAGGGYLSEIVAFDAKTSTLWVSGISGVDVLDARSGSFISRIDTSAWGQINSVAIHDGIAAFALEAPDRMQPGVVKLFDTQTRSLAAGTNSIAVGALPDMLTFTKDGRKLLVANEGTPTAYGARLADSGGHRNYGAPANDPVGSVSIIDMGTRGVTTTSLAGVAQSGANLRTNTGMNFEPEYIATAGNKAYVTLQEANALGVLNLQTGAFEGVVGLGVKDFGAAGNRIDSLNNGTASLQSVNAKGFYMPDGIAAYQAQGKTWLVMANEGDFREDDADRSAGSTFGGTGLLANLRVSNTDSSAGNLHAAGARSFSIRDDAGNLVWDSGEILDREAIAAGIYDDARSRDKGVEPEGVEVLTIGGRTFAFIGLERTTKGAVAVFDITDPTQGTFVQMLVSDGDLAPEGLRGYQLDGKVYLAFSNEGSNTTSVYQLAAVPEPSTYALFAGGLALVALMARRRRE